MKEKLKRFGLLLGTHIGGVLLGTAVSGPLHGMPLDDGGYVGAIMLAPLALTIGIPLDFNFSVSGISVVAGLGISIVCFAWGMRKLMRRRAWMLTAVFVKGREGQNDCHHCSCFKLRCRIYAPKT